MSNRRQFLRDAAATAGVLFTGCNLVGNRLRAQSGAAPKRRQVMVGGRRVKTIDVHAHVVIPEAVALMGRKVEANDSAVMAPQRFQTMDEWRTDMQVLSINANWYSLERDLAAQVIKGRIMIGTDYPFPWSTTTVDQVLNTPGLSDADKRAILGENAARLLKIPA